MSMHRELNPQLFGNQSPVERIGPVTDPSAKPATGIMEKAPETKPQIPYGPNEIKTIEHQVSTLRVAVTQMERKWDGTNAKLEELGKMVHGRLERFSQAIIRLEGMLTKGQQDVVGKMAQINAKVNERKVSDSKIQDLLDRHNTIVRNFENRLLSLQRFVAEQEITLHNAQAALEEARAELAKRR